jgi:hypothetical protein
LYILWGSEHGSSSLIHPIKLATVGGSVGHAAVKFVFPADNNGDLLIDKYVKTSKLKYSKTQDQKCYEVYFSWWPPVEEGQYGNLKTHKRDRKSERKSVHHNWPSDTDPVLIRTVTIYRKDVGPFRGFLRSNITLGPAMIIKYPAMPAGECLSIDGCIDLNLQQQILNSNDPLKDLININETKLQVNYLSLYEKEWNKYDEVKMDGHSKIKYFKKKIIATEESVIEAQEALLKLSSDSVGRRNRINRFIAQKELLITDLESHLKEIEENIQIHKQQKNRLKENFKILFKKDINDYIDFGKEPDHVVELPLKDDLHLGLELEPMLTKAKDISNEEIPFGIYKKNCSATALNILNAGINPLDRRWMAANVANISNNYKPNSLIPLPANPQLVYNSAVQIRDNINNKSQDEEPSNKRRKIG